MQENVVALFKQVRLFSSVAAGIGILLSLIFSGLLQTSSMGWQVVIAVIALAIGIFSESKAQQLPLYSQYYFNSFRRNSNLKTGEIFRYNN